MGKAILVDTDLVQDYASQMANIANEIQETATTLSNLSREAGLIEYSIKGTAPRLLSDTKVQHGTVTVTISSYGLAMSVFAQYSQKLCDGLHAMSDIFAECENKICAQFQDPVAKDADLFGGAGAFGGDLSSSKERDIEGILFDFVGLAKGCYDTAEGVYDKLKGMIDNAKDILIDKTTAEAKGGFSTALFDAKTDEASLSILYVNGDYDAAAGLFVKDKDGNLTVSPYVEIGGGVAFGLATAQLVSSIGNDMLGVHGKAEANLMTGEVVGKAKIALLDKNGNVNPTAAVNASAEVTVASAEAEMGITVAGIDTTVQGEVGIGLGGHVDIGYEQGVIACDIGAYVGVGGSVSIQLDVDKAVDMAVDAVHGAADSFLKLLK